MSPSRAPRSASPKRQRVSNPFPEAAPPGRPKVLSAEEKHQLILAHASVREPVDSVQRFSLWAGVAVCFLAIAVGWVYSMRQTIAGAFNASPVKQTVDEFETTESEGAELQQNLDALMNHLNKVKAQSSAELQTMNAVVEQVQEAASSSTREDLFKSATTNSKTPTTLPSGVKIENY